MSKKETCYWCDGEGCDQCGGVGYYEVLSPEEVERVKEQVEKDYPVRRPQ